MREAFEQEMQRERQKLDAYKRIGPNGVLPMVDDENVDETLVGDPPAAGTGATAGAPEAQSFDEAPRRPDPAAGFGDEAPTDIFGGEGVAAAPASQLRVV